MFMLKVAAAVAVCAGLLLTVVLAFLQGDQSPDERVTFVLAMGAAVLNFVAVPFFLVGLKGFSRQLRRAYFTICFGVALFGLAQLQLPVINMLGWWWWADFGGIALPYLVAVVGIYIGTRSLATLFAVSGFWMKARWAVIITFALTALVAVLPNRQGQVDQVVFVIAQGLIIWDSVFAMFAAALVLRIKQAAGEAYKSAMAWFFVSLAIMAVAGFHYAITQMVFRPGDWYRDYSLTIAPFLLGAMAMVRAGYAFNTTTARQVPVSWLGSFFGRPPSSDQAVAQQSQQPLVDATAYIAGLVSNPTHIDTALDRLRLVTAQLGPNDALDQTQQETVRQVYRDIEAYLIEKEPVRAYTYESLRAQVAERVQLDAPAQRLLFQGVPSVKV